MRNRAMVVSTFAALAGLSSSFEVGWSEESAAASSSLTASASGGVLVAPTRILFEGRDRTAQLTIVNRADSPALYRIAFVHMRMNAAGGLEPHAEAIAGEAYADTLVQFSPKQVLLEPGVPQTVRLRLRIPADLPDGEYRSHLHIRQVPLESPGSADASTAASPAGSGWEVRLRAMVGAAIPVIVRHGATSASLTVSDLELEPSRMEGGPKLVARLHRAGNRSAYGDAIVTYAPKSGSPRVVGAMYGLAVYTPDSCRTVRIPLSRLPSDGLGVGRLEVVFQESARRDAQHAVASLNLP